MITLGGYIILATQTVTLIAAIIGIVSSKKNKAAIQEVHVSINSRMDELLKLTAAASKAEGIKEQKEKE